MDGASSASPDRTSWTAATSCSGDTSLSRNPDAPAASASYTYWSRSNVVSITTRAPEPAPRICRVASSPSITGILMSISTTSGRCSSTAATASLPSAASPATSIPSVSRISRKPPRTSAWSSAITTRTALATGELRQRDRGTQPPPATRPRSRVDRPAVQRDPLPQSEQTAARLRAVAEGPGRVSTVAGGPGRVSTVAEGPGRVSTAGAAPVVADRDHQLLKTAANPDDGRGSRGMPQDGREGF